MILPPLVFHGLSLATSDDIRRGEMTEKSFEKDSSSSKVVRVLSYRRYKRKVHFINGLVTLDLVCK